MAVIATPENPFKSESPAVRVKLGIELGRQLYKDRTLSDILGSNALQQRLAEVTLSRFLKDPELDHDVAIWKPEKDRFGTLKMASHGPGIIEITAEHPSSGLEWQAFKELGLSNPEQHALRGIFSPDAYPGHFARFLIVTPELLPAGQNDPSNIGKLAEVVTAGMDMPELVPAGLVANLKRYFGKVSTFSGRSEGSGLFEVKINEPKKPASTLHLARTPQAEFQDTPYVLIARLAQAAKS